MSWAELEPQNQDAYDDLVIAIEASDQKLSLLLAVCDDSQLRNEIIDRYEAELKPDVRPYRLTLSLEDPSLKAALNQLVAQESHLQAGGRSVVTITGTEQLRFLKLGAERSQQETFFGYLQWTREGLRQFHFPVVLWMTHQMLTDLSQAAPDFWSWRQGVFRFTSRKTAAVPVRAIESIRNLDGLELPDRDSVTIPLADLEALIAQTEAKNPNDPLLASLYSQISKVHLDRALAGQSYGYATELEQAEKYCQKAIALQRQLEQLEDVAISLNRLGLIYLHSGSYPLAERPLEEALQLRKQLLGKAHPDVATSLNNLALLYKSQGRYSTAEPLYLEALELRKQLLGEAHPDVAASLNNLALLYDSQGRYSTAEPLYLEALELRKQLLGEAHPDVATSLNNLAGLYKSQGRYSEAEPLYLEALELSKQLLGEAHPNVATSLNNLAFLYDSQGRHSEAEPLYLEALELSKQLLGEAHPNVATSLNNLAFLYDSQGRYSEAEPLYLEALELRKQLLGEAHPDVAASLNNLAGLYKSQGRYSEAEPLCLEAIKIAKNTLGAKHPNTQLFQRNLEYLRQDIKPRLNFGGG
ncbi:MAG: tetratricopeptide repeat protein [Leptolyngbya sp. SIO4C5]|nr:tetratricopeptide repeat protein [Leptolyngbya sp. SIO4C5]